MDGDQLKIEIVKKMLRKEYIGRRYGRESNILSQYSGRQRKEARSMLRSMASDTSIPVAHYKDKNKSYRLLDAGRAKTFVERLGGNPEVESEYDDLRIVPN